MDHDGGVTLLKRRPADELGLRLNDVRGGADPSQDGAWFHDRSLVGDVVVVKNSDARTIARDNGLNGWNMPWDQCRAGSAR